MYRRRIINKELCVWKYQLQSGATPTTPAQLRFSEKCDTLFFQRVTYFVRYLFRRRLSEPHKCKFEMQSSFALQVWSSLNASRSQKALHWLWNALFQEKKSLISDACHFASCSIWAFCLPYRVLALFLLLRFLHVLCPMGFLSSRSLFYCNF